METSFIIVIELVIFVAVGLYLVNKPIGRK